MRKSSFGGRRASQPVRMDTDDLRSSYRRPAESRGASGIPLPKMSRSSSETRDSRVSASALPQLGKRSKSQVNIFVTPASSSRTPLQGVVGSSQSQRFVSPYSDSGRSSRSSVFPSAGGGKPGRSVKDSRPLSDKAFQQQEIQKIQSFIHSQPDALSFAPKGINLRQLSTKDFVGLVNYLIGFVDERIGFNMTDYVNEVPAVMKRYGYGGNLNSSWLKTVNTPHAFPHVLGLLSWLTVLASSAQKTDYEAVLQQAFQTGTASEEEEQLFPFGNAVIYMQHLMRQYSPWNSNDAASEENEETRFIQELCNRNGVSDEELTKVAESVRNLETQLNDPKEKAEAEAAQEEERKYLEFMKDFNKCVEHKVRMEEFLNTTDNLLEEEKRKLQKDEENLELLHERVQELKEQLSRQTMSPEQRDELLALCKEIHGEIRENEEYITVLSNRIYADDLDMVKKRENIKKKTTAYNTIILNESYWLPELEALKNDTNFLHQGAEQELARIDSLAVELKAQLNRRREELQGLIGDLREQCHQAGERHATLMQEVEQHLEKMKQKEEAIEKLRIKCAEEKEVMKRDLETLKASNEALMKCDSLETAKEELKKLIALREYGKKHIESLKLKAEEFFKKSVAITQGLITTVEAAEAEFLKERDEQFKILAEIHSKRKAEVEEIERDL